MENGETKNEIGKKVKYSGIFLHSGGFDAWCGRR